MFGPEYDAVDFHSNRYLATIIRDSLGGTEQQVAHRRPDFVALPDRSRGIYSAAFYEDRAEISGIRQILVVELKKGGFKLSQKELDQARDYSKELCKAADVRVDVKIVAYVLGADGEEGLEAATYIRQQDYDYPDALQDSPRSSSLADVQLAAKNRAVGFG
jgi:hypothetical protein